MIEIIINIIIWLYIILFTRQNGFFFFIKNIVYAVAEINTIFIKKLYRLTQYKNKSQYLKIKTAMYNSYERYEIPKTFFVDLIFNIKIMTEYRCSISAAR